MNKCVCVKAVGLSSPNVVPGPFCRFANPVPLVLSTSPVFAKAGFYVTALAMHAIYKTRVHNV